MRKVSKSRVDDDLVSSTNGSVTEEPAGADDNDKRDDEDYKDEEEPKDKEDANGSLSGDDEPLESSSSKASKTPKKSKKAKKGRKKKAAKSTKNDASHASEDEDEPEEEYEVEKVVGSKKMKGKLHYLIRWKGYSASSDTWEPEDTLSCPELIKKFKDEDQGGSTKEEKTPKKSPKRKAGKAKESKPAKRPKADWDSENADENAEYEVERILEVHHKKNGDREFLIHWKGWSSKFDSWEPEEHLNCSEMIKKFMEKVDKAKSSDNRSLRVAPESTNRYTLQAPSTGRRLSKRQGQRQRVRYDNAE